jgi:hypothetical protein
MSTVVNDTSGSLGEHLLRTSTNINNIDYVWRRGRHVCRTSTKDHNDDDDDDDEEDDDEDNASQDEDNSESNYRQSTFFVDDCNG